MTQRSSRALRVLVVSHDATRTGAPIQLLHTWTEIVRSGAADVRFLLMRGGELEGQFAQTAPTTVLPRLLPGAQRALEADVTSGVRRLEHVLLSAFLRRQRSFDVVVVNTTTLGRIMKTLVRHGLPVVTHAHEMNQWMSLKVSQNDLRDTITESQALIAVSDAARRSLLERGASPERVRIVYEAIPWMDFQTSDRRSAQRLLGSTGPVIGGAGTLDTRKGPDLFLQVAARVGAALADAAFVWLGTGTAEQRSWLTYDIARGGLEARACFLGAVPDPERYYAGFDLFALTSREDPCPLVMLEAAAAGVPVIAFDGSGGASEFVADGCGLLVPYMRTDLMADQIVDLLGDRKKLEAIAVAGQKRVRERHDISRAAAEVWSVVESVAHGTSTSG